MALTTDSKLAAIPPETDGKQYQSFITAIEGLTAAFQQFGMLCQKVSDQLKASQKKT